jgi:hypothetical protein
MKCLFCEDTGGVCETHPISHGRARTREGQAPPMPPLGLVVQAYFEFFC